MGLELVDLKKHRIAGDSLAVSIEREGARVFLAVRDRATGRGFTLSTNVCGAAALTANLTAATDAASTEWASEFRISAELALTGKDET